MDCRMRRAYVKVELVSRLGRAGVQIIEAGSFVSPRCGTRRSCDYQHRPWARWQTQRTYWRRQNASRMSTIPFSSRIKRPRFRHHPPRSTPAPAADGRNRDIRRRDRRVARTSTRQPPSRWHALPPWCLQRYVSVVIACPYTGQVDYVRLRDIAKDLIDMGCYEVSLGDTVGMGTPAQVSPMLEEVTKYVPVQRLPGHFHDTYGTAVANVLTALDYGVRTIHASVGGLGGCPCSPGNVATEDAEGRMRASFSYPCVAFKRGGGTRTRFL
ncbi:hypothetical protein K438DRAFT_1043889 [Mycena galopus ATCC 62051]|nr:hypothetical protein K438DRAFT_1043691 [Mycena galopus ATCC 62051]KAF8185794.1 hypothetical protein K438DRAFT_1043889 [Mycena galopus ATCC 62051]